MLALRSVAAGVTRWAAVIVLLTLAAQAGSRQALPPDGACGNGQNMLEAEQAGSIILQRVLSTGMRWEDASLNEYVNRLGQNLARSSGSQQVFSFYVLYNPEVNAQAFPGGYIVLNTGVISLAESEAELASVLSHEIAHENACDWRAAPSKGNLLELAAIVPALVLAGPAGTALTMGTGVAGRLVGARQGRAKEERADRLALQYLVRAGYDPHATAQFFQRLEAEEERSDGEPHGVLATHPRSADREEKLEKVIANLPPRELVPHDESEFLRMRRAVREYDEMYSRLVGVHIPGRDSIPSPLFHRPSDGAGAARQ